MTDSEGFKLILAEIQGMKSDMQGMKSDMQDMKSDMQGMKSDIQGMKSEMQGMKSDMQDMKSDIHNLKNGVQKLEQRVAGIELNLENVTNRNIRIIAEGHLDLSRKLDEALKVKEERELLITRVNVLDGEMRKVKEQLAV